MNKPLKLLILEDSADDAQLLLLQLKRDSIEVEWQRVETEANFRAALDSTPDLILADYSLPTYTGIKALELVNQRGLNIPFILVSGTMGEDMAVTAMKNGAADYLLKDRLTRLGEAIRHALEQKQLREEKRITDASMAASEDRYRDLVENSQDLICTHDLEGIILSANPASSRLLGYDLSELIGSNLRDHLVPDVRDNFKYYINRLKRNGSAAGHLMVQTKGGERRVWEYQNTLRSDGVAEPVVRGMARDVTERKQAEEDLQASETRFRALIERNADLILVIDAEGIIQFVSPSSERILGYSSAETLGRNFLEWVHPDDLPIALKSFESRREISGPAPAVVEVRSLHKNGSWRTVDVLGTNLLTEPAVRGIVLNIRDITERKRVEDEIRRLNEFNENLINNMSEGIVVQNTDGEFTFVNPAVLSITGYQAEELIGGHWTKFIPADQHEIIKEADNRRLAGQASQYEIDFLHKSGRRISQLVSGSPLFEAGRFTGTMAVFVDITERKKDEQALRESEEKFKTLFNSANDAIFTMNHTTFLDCNATTEKIFRCSRDRIVGQSPVAFSPERQVDSRLSSESAVEKIEAAFAGEPQFFEWTHLHLDGTPFDAEVSLNRVFIGGEYILQAIVRDITERKLAEEEIKRHRDEFAALFETARDLTVAQEIDQLMETILKRAIALVNAHAGSVALFDEVQRNVELIAASNLEAPLHTRIALGEGLNGRVAESLQPMIVNDYRAWEHRIGVTSNEARAVAAVPMLHQGKLIGILSVEESPESARQYSQADLDLLILLASPAAGAVQSARLYQQAQEEIAERKKAEEKIRVQLERLSALREIDQTIASTFDLRLSLNVLIGHTSRLLAVDAVSVLLLNSAFNTLEYGVGRGFRGATIKTTSIKLGESYAGRAAIERRIVEIPNMQAEPNDLFQTGFLKDEKFVSYYGAPLIVKGKVVGVLEVFHRSLVERDMEWHDFFSAMAGQAAIAIDNAKLFENLQVSNSDLFHAYDATIEGWSRALDLRDKETEGHTQRVTAKTLALARSMGLADDQLSNIRRGALLHDMGKMGVPDSILLKPGSLTDEEWVIMRKHPTFAFELLSPIRYLKSAAIDIPYCHHEKWDGTGYPRGLKGEQIPLTARIFAVVDMWDALTSDRPYRPAWSKKKALAHIRSLAGTHFDPEVARVFLESDVR